MSDEPREQLAQALAALDALAAEWLNLHAAGRVQERIAFDRRVDEQIAVTRRLERRLRRHARKTSRNP